MVSQLPPGARRFPLLFTPLRVRGVTFANRLFMAPMGLDLALDDGSLSDELLQFYRDIIAGGVGGLYLSNASVARQSVLRPRGLRLLNARQAASLRPLLQLADVAGVAAGVQLQHYGGQGMTTYSGVRVLLTPSGVPSPALQRLDPNYQVRAMRVRDIPRIRVQFVRAAKLAVDAGARLLQLQASNGYLLSSFLSPYTNRRRDGYGGSVEARARLLSEIVRDIRLAVGDEVVLGVRLQIDDLMGTAGVQVADMRTVLPLLELAGADLIEASVGNAETFNRFSGPGQEMAQYFREQVSMVRRFTKLPLGFAGMTADLPSAEVLLAEGVCDLVGMARPLFADNDLIVKTLRGEESRIHRCRFDGLCFKDKHDPRMARVYCCVNPKYLRPVFEGASCKEGM